MKIAVWHNLPSGGGARALQYHLDGLVERGHEVSLWAGNPDANGFLKIPEKVKIHQVPLNSSTEFSLSDKISGFWYAPNSKMKAMEAHCKACAEEINAGGFDVFFANTCFCFAVPFIGKFIKIPSALYLGEPFRMFYEAQPRYVWQAPESANGNWLRRSYWQPFWNDLWRNNQFRVQAREEQKNIHSYNKLLVNSYFSSESCQRAYNTPGDVCYLGIDDKVFRRLPNSTIKNYVIGLGNLYFNKNVALAILAVATIPKEIRPELFWVSNMEDTENIASWKSLAKDYDVSLVIHSRITDETLVLLLNEAICMIYTSILEPFGFAPLEANLCGTPVVAVRQGGVKETVIDGQNGFLCEAKPKPFAEKIMRFIQEPSLRQKMGLSAENHVIKNWNLTNCTQNIEQALLSLIEKPTASSNE